VKTVELVGGYWDIKQVTEKGEIDKGSRGVGYKTLSCNWGKSPVKGATISTHWEQSTRNMVKKRTNFGQGETGESLTQL